MSRPPDTLYRENSEIPYQRQNLVLDTESYCEFRSDLIFRSLDSSGAAPKSYLDISTDIYINPTFLLYLNGWDGYVFRPKERIASHQDERPHDWVFDINCISMDLMPSLPKVIYLNTGADSRMYLEKIVERIDGEKNRPSIISINVFPDSRMWIESLMKETGLYVLSKDFGRRLLFYSYEK